MILRIHSCMTRKEAAQQNSLVYEGKLHTCGTRQKYTQTRNCVHCKTRLTENEKSRRKSKYRLLREKALNHYSDGNPQCRCCGETINQFLQLDHIHGNGNQHRKTLTVTIWSWLEKHAYPPGFQVLCANCNFGRNLNSGVCPHHGTISA